MRNVVRHYASFHIKHPFDVTVLAALTTQNTCATPNAGVPVTEGWRSINFYERFALD